MPHLKTENIKFDNPTSEYGYSYKKVKISVSKEGYFYVNLEPEFIIASESILNTKINDGVPYIKVSDSNCDSLIRTIKEILELHHKPEVIEEPVILYNIESHISFCQNDDGEIFPNGTFEGAKWRISEKYGNHAAAQPSTNGYSLTIGAKAKLKITLKYGDSKRVEYKDYYKGGSHLGHDNPAQLLNSWQCFSLKRFKEIPYSDESALFFHNLMLGMAKISKLIQDNTFEQENLLNLIASGTNPLLPNNKKIIQ